MDRIALLIPFIRPFMVRSIASTAAQFEQLPPPRLARVAPWWYYTPPG